jgi:cell division protein FtsL
MNGRLNLVVTTVLVLCALSLVNAQYHARSLFIELERAQVAARQLDIEWAQLQLDQSTLGKHARIETTARQELHMMPVTPARTQYLLAGAAVPAAASGSTTSATGTNTAPASAPGVK